MQTVTKPEINQFINKGYLIKKNFLKTLYKKNFKKNKHSQIE